VLPYIRCITQAELGKSFEEVMALSEDIASGKVALPQMPEECNAGPMSLDQFKEMPLELMLSRMNSPSLLKQDLMFLQEFYE